MHCCWLFLVFLFVSSANAQRFSGWSIAANAGTTWAHSVNVAGLRSTKPLGIELNLIRQKDTQKNFDRCNCYPQSGLSLSLFDYGNNAVLGQGINLNIFLEPQFKLNQRFYFLIRGAAGLAFLNNPYHPINNPENKAYSLPVSGFLSLGPGIRFFIKEKNSIFFVTNFNHVSNGGIKDPNIGLNFPGIQLGYTHLNKSINRNFKRNTSAEKNTSGQSLAFTAFFSSRTVANGEKKRFLIYGFESSYAKKLTELWIWNSALEFYKDDAQKERYRRVAAGNKDRYKLGLMSGLEINLGEISLYHRIGMYLYDPGLYNGLVFHRHGIQYSINKKLSAGLEMKAHRQVANFLDFRLKYTLTRPVPIYRD